MRSNRISLRCSFSTLVCSTSESFAAIVGNGRLRRRLRRQAVYCLLILSLLYLPSSNYAYVEAPTLIASLVRVSTLPIAPLSLILKRLFGNRTSARQDTDARTNRVSTLIISPGKIVAYVSQSISFSAIGKDSLGEIAQGARFDWSSSDETKLRIDQSGEATCIFAGLVWVTASTRFASARAPVLIRPGTRRLQTDSEWEADQRQLRPDGSVGTTTGGVGALLDSLIEKIAPTAHAQASGGDSADFLYDELWSEPRNLVGAPPNRVLDTSMIGAVLPEGSNFELSLPIESLPGRGLPFGLALNYNSRVWSRHGNAVTFNQTNTWPYVGFSISFGRIVTYGPSSALKYLLIESDGTRRFLGTGGTAGQTVTLQTNDGSHITYVGNATGGGALYFNNGVKKTVNAVNNRLLVTRIRDANGNYIDISYASQSSGTTFCVGIGNAWMQALNSITDTLGRVITFTYDDCNNLVSITGPDYGSGAQTLVQFDYLPGSISDSFSGLTVENRPIIGSVNQLKHVYFPATQTGYKFDYSVYGMIYNVSMRKQMSIDGNGAISDGTEKAYVTFNYPAIASSLTDAPSFSQRTQFPAATSGGTAVYSYSTSSGSGTKSFIITRPDSSTVTLTRSDTAGVDFGLLTQSEVKNSSGTSMSKSLIAYANDPGGSAQVQSIISYDDASPTANQTKVDFDYDSHGNVTNTREYGFQDGGQWKVRRRSRSVYKTDTAYVDEYLRSLVIESDVYDAQMDTSDANDVLIAKTTYTFDDYNALGGMENYGGAANPPGHLSSYDTTKTVRGNVTGQTVYTDVGAGTSTTWLMKLDIFGNVTKRQLACCNEQTTTYSDQNGYGLAELVAQGPSGGAQATHSTAYDFNTSLATEMTDPNGLTTEITTRDEALRPTLITYPTGATLSAGYNDAGQSVSQSVSYDDGGTQRTIGGSAVYDGWGQMTSSVDANGAKTNYTYDIMGRRLTQTNPFPQGGTPGPVTTNQYDQLGRVTLVTLPGGNTVQTAYTGGNIVTVTDQVNRKIKRESDGLGRLIKVTEQDVSTGALSQDTTYTYDVADRLIGVNQGGQTRAFKYDAEGQLLFERIPEQSATINDGGGTMWSTKYTYTSFGAIATRQDARGVITTYGYDSLNRLTSISYNTSGAPGVASTPNVTYNYDNNQSSSTKGLLLSVSAGSGYSESYSYDSFKRVQSVTRTIDGRNYTTSYQQNTANQPTQMTYPSGRVLNLGHDSKGRLTSVGSYLTSVTYNGIGQLTGTSLGNGVSESYGYDANRMQLTSQNTAVPGNGPLMSVAYSYQAQAGQMGAGTTAGNAGQLMAITCCSSIGGLAELASYTYDNVGRLVTSSQTTNGVSAQRRFAYDRWGNRGAVYDAVSGGTLIQNVALEQSGGAPTNRISALALPGWFSTYTYDAAGNVTWDGVHTYTYDAKNRLVNVDGGGSGQYAYDLSNQRYKKVTGGVTTHYIWQGSHVIAEHNGSTGAVLVDYVYSGSRMIAKVASGTTEYFLSDRLSTRLVLDVSGNVLGRQAHLPFGEDFAESGSQEKHHFTSYERDGETGTDYAVNRYYSQIVGRFNRPDPKRSSCQSGGEPQGANRYTYTRSNPINSTDRLGLDDSPLFPPDPWDPLIPVDHRMLCSLFPEYCGNSGNALPFEIIRDVISETGGTGSVDDFDYGFSTTMYKYVKFEKLTGGLVSCKYVQDCSVFNSRSTCGHGNHRVITDNPNKCKPWLQTTQFYIVAFGDVHCGEIGIWTYLPFPVPCT